METEKPVLPSKKLKILIIGYYGHLNAGDDILMQAMSYIFMGHKLMFSSWQPSTLVMNECDLVVIGGGSIYPDFGFFQNAKDIVKTLKVPFMVIGISARREINESEFETTQGLLDKAEFFHVRDQFTHELLRSSSKILCGADLFWWMPWNKSIEASSKDPNTIALNLRSWKSEYKAPELVRAIKSESQSLLPFPFFYGSSSSDVYKMSNDASFMRSIGLNDIPDHFSDYPLSIAGLCVAMRYHAVLLSVRARVPVISFSYHPKIIAFYAENGLAELCIPLNETLKLNTTIALVKSNYDYYENKMDEIAKRLAANGEDCLGATRAVLSQIGPRKPPGLISRIGQRVIQYLK